ncbi:MAG: hypothetical protein ACN4EP_00260, partial [Sediminibacterium sp.]
MLTSNTHIKLGLYVRAHNPEGFFNKPFSLFIVLFLLFFSTDIFAQCGTGTSPIYDINFSAAKDTSWTLNAARNGTACVGTSGEDDRCIRFNVMLNSGSDLLNFTADQLTGASFYSINC